MQKNNDSDGGKERDSICSHVPILWFYYPTASASLRLLTCHVYTCAQPVHIQIGVCDTQPSITSLESSRSCCAPIHTLSHCFDFSKYKDVNQLPPLVRRRGIHTRRLTCAPVCACAPNTRGRARTHINYPSLSSSHFPPSLFRSLITPPQPFHYLRVISCASMVHNTLLMDN